MKNLDTKKIRPVVIQNFGQGMTSIIWFWSYRMSMFYTV